MNHKGPNIPMYNKNKSTLLVILITGLILFLAITGCNRSYTPKPKGYMRIDFPEKEYQQFDSSVFPYSFEYPKYGNIEPSAAKNTNPYSINIAFPKYKGKIHLSYKTIRGNLKRYTEDARSFAYKHTVKAQGIDETFYKDSLHQVYGLLYDIEGNVASSVQFFVTDSSRHFLRGALYFYTKPHKDSLAPVISFFRKDIIHLMETVRWK